MFYMTCLKLTVQLKSVVEKNVVIKVVDVFQFIYGDVWIVQGHLAENML